MTTPNKNIVEELPPDISKAALQLTAYFANRGVLDWQVGGACSRYYANELERLQKELSEFIGREQLANAVRDKLLIENQDLQQQVVGMREVLSQIEWHDKDSDSLDGQCIFCGHSKPYGHSKECKWVKALSDTATDDQKTL